MAGGFLFGVFGTPIPGCAVVPADAVQLSPLVPNSLALEDVTRGSLAGMVMAAPPGTLERQYVLAVSLRALRAGAPLTVMAPKEKGGSRLVKELESFGCVVEATSRRHQRICQMVRPGAFDDEVQERIDVAIAAGGPRFADALDLWTQAGIFSWDRIDSGTALLLSALPSFTGHGADLGCGAGIIGRTVLASANVTRLDLVDIDRRAIAAARRNIADRRATFHWVDVRRLDHLKDLDFIVMNPPFHDGGMEDRALGQTFVQRCHHLLRDGGTAWLVANRHLPYEAVLASAFSQVILRTERDGFKVYEAIK